MAAPAIAGLKNLYPGCEISALIREEFAGLLTTLRRAGDGGALFSDVFTLENGGKRLSEAILRDLAHKRADAAVILPNSFKSAWQVWKLGVKERIGYRGELRSALLTVPVPRPPKHSLSQREHYLNLVRAAYPDVNPGRFRVLETSEAGKNAERLLRGLERPIVGVGFGASYGSAKMWPAERFAALIGRLREYASVVLLGADSDRGAERAVLERCADKPLSLVGRTDLPTLAAVMMRLSLYITNDTGPMHLAAASNVPTIAVFGPTSPEETAPEGEKVTVIYHRADCAPCWKRECPMDQRCMKAITVDEVLEKAVATLGNPARREA